MACQLAYVKLCGNIDLAEARVETNPRAGSFFVTHTVWTEVDKVWEIKANLRQRKRFYNIGNLGETVIRTYGNQDGILSPIAIVPLPQLGLLERVMVGLS